MNKNTKTALFIGGIVIAILIITPLVFGTVSGWHGGGWGMMGPGMMGGFGGMWFMPVFFIIFWGLVIWGITAVVRGQRGSSSPDSALEVLKKRYARGEIDKEEYEEKKKDLE